MPPEPPSQTAHSRMKVRPVDKETQHHTLQVLVVTSARLTPCVSAMGSYLNTLSLFNKQNFAQLHGYGFHWNMVQVDPKLKVRTAYACTVEHHLAFRGHGTRLHCCATSPSSTRALPQSGSCGWTTTRCLA